MCFGAIADLDDDDDYEDEEEAIPTPGKKKGFDFNSVDLDKVPKTPLVHAQVKSILHFEVSPSLKRKNGSTCIAMITMFLYSQHS